MKTKNIEAEIRSFVSPKKHQNLLRFFKKAGKFLGKENQQTYYFSGRNDLRIQRSGKTAKIWLKKGKMHDDSREEIEIAISPKQFERVVELFEYLGYEIKIKWFRERQSFSWEGITVMLDNTRGYGHIIELEKMCHKENKEKIISELRSKLHKLGIEQTDKNIFEEKFKYYEKNWKKLIR